MLECNVTVTLVRHVKHTDRDEYVCHVLNGCSWYGAEGDTLSNQGETPSANYRVRIPEESLTAGLMPTAGDFVVYGAVNISNKRELAHQKSFRIGHVGDNRRGVHLRHVVVSDA